MLKYNFYFYLLIFKIVFLDFFINSNLVKAQSIKIDGTTPTQLLNCSSDCNITGGLKQGNNLFHSFENFNVKLDATVTFDDISTEINNIFSRVTGGTISEILGTLDVAGSDANLFLINPNGIIFGEQSSLDINGSFIGTTADAIRFGEQGLLNTTPNAIPLLTINPSAFLFSQDNPGIITNRSITGKKIEDVTPTNLEVPDGKSLLLIGGDIKFDKTNIIASGGLVELGGLAEAGEIKIDFADINGHSISLDYSNKIKKSNVVLDNGAYVDVAGIKNTGEVVINAENITISNKSIILAGIGGDAKNISNSKLGNISLNATQKIDITNGSLIAYQIFSNGKGNSGNIDINSRSLFVSQNSVINNTVLGNGNAGNINIVAKEILLTEDSDIDASNGGRGNAGNIKIEVEEDIIMSSDSDIKSVINLEVIGNSGNIKIKAKTLSLNGGSQITNNVNGIGIAGEILLEISDSISITGFSQTIGFSSGVVTATQNDAEGDAGDIIINTNNLRIANGGIISSQTLNQSRGGDIFITAKTVKAIDGGQVVSSADNDSGNAGNIDIVSNDILLSGSDSNLEERLANYPDNVSNEQPGNSGFFASVRSDGSGLGGNIKIETKNLNIQENADIGVSATGIGEAGRLTITANTINLDRGSLTATTAAGEGGNIEINLAQNLILENNSLISAEALEQANGGNVEIDAQFIIALPENNDIVASAQRGNGGNIDITAESLFGIAEKSTPSNTTNDIDASSEFGFDGTISINTPDVNPASELTELPDVPIDVSALLEQNLCDVEIGDTGKSSSFINIGRGGLPSSPYEPLDNNHIFVDVKLPTKWAEEITANDSVSQPPTKPIVEATNWVVNQKGNVELVSQEVSVNSQCGGK